jgi:hypothetical protein
MLNYKSREKKKHMAARKTFPVAKLLKHTNFLLKMADDRISLDQKKILCSMIETVLHETGNYAGFGYYDEVSRIWAAAKTPEMGNPYSYRRQYYVSRLLHSEYRRLESQ